MERRRQQRAAPLEEHIGDGALAHLLARIDEHDLVDARPANRARSLSYRSRLVVLCRSSGSDGSSFLSAQTNPQTVPSGVGECGADVTQNSPFGRKISLTRRSPAAPAAASCKRAWTRGMSQG